MRTHSILACLTAILMSAACLAEDSSIFKMASPKLKQFLGDHPAASQALVGAWSQSFSNRTMQLYYFYSDDETIPRCSHYYPDESVVGVLIRENQEPSDEFISLLFEILNSQGEKRFLQLMDEARSGAISRRDFPREMLRQEFQATMRVKSMLGSFKLTKGEIDKSYYYEKFMGCPDDFEKSLSYRPKGATREPFKEYEQKYDFLRKTP